MQTVSWNDFPITLRRVRQQNGLTQLKVADLLGYDRIHIWRLEHGRRRPSKAFLHAFVRVCPPKEADVRLWTAFERMLEYRLEDADLN
jgi:transcriptional regulator with XRE-family HTH domain